MTRQFLFKKLKFQTANEKQPNIFFGFFEIFFPHDSVHIYTLDPKNPDP